MPDIPVRETTDADYNAHSRQLEQKIEIYFDGMQEEPLTVTINDYLIDVDVLEEASAEDTNPLGAISANELNFTLFNANGIFSPTNASSPYYSKIKTGVVVIPYIRPVLSDGYEAAWDQMGVYYVSDWTAAIVGSTASVTATDKLQKVFNEPTPNIPVRYNVSQKDLFEEVFDTMGYVVTVSPSLSEVLAYSFTEGSQKEFLQEMLQGAISYCTCTKTGNIVVDALDGFRPLRATITDDNQIISVDAKQSILKTYEGVSLTYVKPQLTDEIQLLQVKDAKIPNGYFEHSTMAFTQGPVKSISSAYVLTKEKEVYISDYVCTSWDITLTTKNESSQAISDIVVNGYAVDFVEAILADTTVSNVLTVSNKYIQSTEYAQRYKELLEAFVGNDVPNLTLSIRGNPRLAVGDKIRVQSTKYHLDFTGVLLRLNYHYIGSLSCEITLLNSEILEVDD